MREVLWPYIAALGLAVTICSNLDGFFLLGRAVRSIIENWEYMIFSFWGYLGGFIGIEVSYRTARMLTIIAFILSLAATSGAPPFTKIGIQFQAFLIKLFGKDLEGTLDSMRFPYPLINYPLTNYAHVPGIRGFSFYLLVYLFMFWIVLFSLNKNIDYYDSENWRSLSFLAGIAISGVHMAINIGALLKIENLRDDEKNFIRKYRILEKNISPTDNQRITQLVISRFNAEVLARVLLRLSTIVGFVVLIIGVGVASYYLEEYQLDDETPLQVANLIEAMGQTFSASRF